MHAHNSSAKWALNFGQPTKPPRECGRSSRCPKPSHAPSHFAATRRGKQLLPPASIPSPAMACERMCRVSHLPHSMHSQRRPLLPYMTNRHTHSCMGSRSVTAISRASSKSPWGDAWAIAYVHLLGCHARGLAQGDTPSCADWYCHASITALPCGWDSRHPFRAHKGHRLASEIRGAASTCDKHGTVFASRFVTVRPCQLQLGRSCAG